MSWLCGPTLGLRCRCLSFFLLDSKPRCKRDLRDNHTLGFFDIGVGHWHVRPKGGPLYNVPFRIHEDGALGVIILYRSGARFRAEGDSVRSWRAGGNRTEPVRLMVSCWSRHLPDEPELLPEWPLPDEPELLPELPPPDEPELLPRIATSG